jgi:hypothetical protein
MFIWLITKTLIFFKALRQISLKINFVFLNQPVMKDEEFTKWISSDIAKKIPSFGSQIRLQ